MIFSSILQNKYKLISGDIQKKLLDYSEVDKTDNFKGGFYELCFCICTPQSKARSALAVQEILMNKNFKENAFNPTEILADKNHYIRFHNQKAKRLLELRDNWVETEKLINSNLPNIQKRNLLAEKVLGIGMKEASHFLRNIGYRNLGILDRHILKHLVNCGLINEIPNLSSKKKYLEIEQKFLEFSEKIKIPLDELDLLFWSEEAGEILK
jgi:N-glycosylase/DNA lyase